MPVKVLVLYGSRWGGTVAVAEKIGQVFIENGHTADIFDAKKVPENLNSYDLCIIGSGIRADKWTKETLTFMEKNSGILQTKKTALFVSCQMADRKNGAREKAKDLYLQKTAEKYREAAQRLTGA